MSRRFDEANAKHPAWRHNLRSNPDVFVLEPNPQPGVRPL